MDRRSKTQMCTACFLFLTAVKIISPVTAATIKLAYLPLINRDDSIENMLSMNRTAPSEHDKTAFQAPLLLDELRSRIITFDSDYMADIPKVSHRPSLTAHETEADSAVAFGLSARDAFLEQQAEYADIPVPANVSYDVLSLPFDETSPISGFTSSGFGYRVHPIEETVLFHYGTDFAAEEGTEIHAFADGTVYAAGEEEGYGKYLMVDHGNGYTTLYGHCSELLAQEGQQVGKGDVIALVGQTGRATGPHLHFELMHDGMYLNPEFYLIQ